MASLCPKASTGRLRVYSPALEDDTAPWKKEREYDRGLLLVKIQHHYKEALERLTVRWRSDVQVRFLDEGICVGLLDPVSSIIANTLLAATAAPVDRASALADAADGPRRREDLERRSLDGLVAFLTCFFPYLADWEAVRYLLLAEADPLVAARIVVEDRGGLRCFRADSDATGGALRLALRCATVAARHPRPSQLADVWLALSGGLDKAVSLLSAVQANFPRSIISSFQTLVMETAAVPPPPPSPTALLVRPWELAAGRGKHAIKVTSYQHSWSLRRVLLDTIHGFYLQALARMPQPPAGGSPSRYHRSLLKAGHCYGPFDPVSNIIVNTIWYEAAFPPLSRLDELDILGTLSLMRIEAQSFYGLVSYLCTDDHGLSVHQAMRCLLETDLSLVETKQCGSVLEEAFRAAAIAAWHPRPDAQAGFLSSCKEMSAEAVVLSLLQDGSQRQFSSQGFQQQPASILPRQFNGIMADGSEQRRAHRKISRKVKAALNRYEKQNPGYSYQLHVVCGVNQMVSGPDNREEFIMKLGKHPDIDYYHHMHANFLVSVGGATCSSAPILFFAELSNYDDDERDGRLLCCPMDFPPPGAEPVRCLFCEHEGIRIVHPAQERFHGREAEFEKMIRGEEQYENDYYPAADVEVYTSERMLRHSEFVAHSVYGIPEEDCMYFGRNDFIIRTDDSDEEEYYDDL